MRKYAIFIGLLLSTQSLLADPAEVLDIHGKHTANGWRFSVTLQHPDTGWDHYANAWRIVDGKGAVLGERVLFHPHVNEQPFTRSLAPIEIPDNLDVVYVQASDTENGYADQKYPFHLVK